MKKALYLFTADFFVPFYYQLARYLQAADYAPEFVTFTLRESLLLKKNQIRSYPDNVFKIHEQIIREGMFSDREVEETLDFAVLKCQSSRKDLRARFLKVASYLYELFEKNQYSFVVIWNGEEITMKAGVLIANKFNVPVVFIENGYFPRTLQIDLSGVNIKNSVSSLSFQQCKEIFESQQLSRLSPRTAPTIENGFRPLSAGEYFYCGLVRKILPFYYRYFPEKKGNSWFTDFGVKLVRKAVPTDKAQLPEQFVFIPFQVHDDTQVVLNSRFFKDMESFFEFSYKLIKRHFDEHFKIVVKEHPEDLGRKSYEHLQAKYPDVIWLKKFNLEEILNKASYTFVLNSSVGLQAMERLHPVIAFGESFYAKEELVFKVNALEDADRVILLAKQGLSEERKSHIAAFIQFLKQEYFVKSTWKNPTAQEITAAGNRILMQVNHE